MALILAISLAMSGCAKHTGADDEAKAESTAVPDVTVTTVERKVITRNLSVSGNLASLPNRDAKIAPLVAGRIARVSVTEGDRVSQGQVLAELETASLIDEVKKAEAAVSQAKANVENASFSLKRNEGLRQRGIAAGKEVEDARTQLAVNEAALQQAEAILSTARTQLSRAAIRAPFNGTVVRRFLGAGEQVDGSTQPVVEVADIDTLELMGTVPASLLSDIKPGTEFEFETSSVPGNKFKAHIDSVLPAVDPGTNNGTVRIRIDNRKRLLKFGMFVSIEVPLQQPGKRLVVARQAIYPDESGEPHAYKLEGAQVESVPVQLGVQTKDEVEILSGLQEGDKVILTGGYGLPEKARVHVKQ